MKAPKRPIKLMTLAQGICAAAALLMLVIFAIPLLYAAGYALEADYVNYDNTLIVAIMGIIFALPDAALGTLMAYVGVEAFCICGRVRKASAFSAKNEKSLGRIALALCIAGVTSLLFGSFLFPWLLTGLPTISPIVERLLLPFILLTLALMIRTVQVLMRRALTMQEESDLTV